MPHPAILGRFDLRKINSQFRRTGAHRGTGEDLGVRNRPCHRSP